MRRWNRGLFALIAVGLSWSVDASSGAGDSSMMKVTSRDGTLIAVECAGAGPNLLLVHGGAGDRTRWTPLFPLLSQRFRVCAMDRRGHGLSGDRADYSMTKEAEDVVAVVSALAEPVFVLGHSYGGVAALEASLFTDKIAKLVLYEPPLRELDQSSVADQMEAMIRAGDRELATTTFLREVVMVSPAEIAAMKSRPSWPGLVASIGSSVRQMRALSRYRFDPSRVRTLRIPTLLLTGSKTASPQLKLAISSLMDALPNRTLVVLEGQEHNAMDSDREHLADVLTKFLINPQEAHPPR